LFPTSVRVYVWRTPNEANNPEYLVPNVKRGDGSVMICAALSWYSAGPIVTLHGRIIASNYVGNLGQQVHPMFQVFLKNDVIF